tara:strand:- start:895 stop:1293 length:399 start_codon:yes stop_codon:yes gene_type:complete
MPSDFELDESEAKTIRISFDASKSYNALLQFNSDLNNGTTLSIPIVSDATVGLNEIDDNVLELFPNPSTGLINIKSKIGIKKTLVLDLNGEIIDENEKTREKMDLSHLSPGFYFVKIILEDNRIINRRIIIQ